MTILSRLRINLKVFLHTCGISAGRISAYKLITAAYHQSSALRARFFHWTCPAHKFTLRIVGTPVIDPALLLAFDHKVSAAFRTGNAGFFKVRFRVPALREPRAGQKLPVGAVFDDHPAAAEVTYFIAQFIRDLYTFQILFRRLYRSLQIRIEVFDDRLPWGLSFSHCIQQKLQICRKGQSTIAGKDSTIMRFTTSPISVT